MSQEMPTQNDEEEEEMVDISSELEDALSEDADARRSVLEVLQGMHQVEAISSISDQVEELTNAMQAGQDYGIADDPEVMRAIQQINSEQDTAVDVTQKPQEVAEQVSELYDGEQLKAMRELLEEHNLRIVQQLLASDTGALSPKEVAFRNKGIISESTVRDHLRTLTEKGFVEKLEPDVESIPNEMPQTFYAASPFAIELLQEMGLWENLGMLYQIYDTLDRPKDLQRIEEWEDRPIPEWL